MRINLESIPAELKARNHWVCWQYETHDGRRTKVPYQPNGAKADSTDPATWSTLDACIRANGKFDGIGITCADGLAGVDLDRCVADDGRINGMAQRVISKLQSYTEVTPSGRGLRVLVWGKLPPGGRRKDALGIEMYDTGRYFTVTGNHLPDTPTCVEHREVELTKVHAEIFGEPSNGTPAPRPVPKPVDLDDADLLEKAKRAKNGSEFERLWNGDTSAHDNNHSSADLALCSMLAFWTGGDPERIDRLFRQSGLMRPKWDERHSSDGRTYGQMTIEKALQGATEFYAPTRSAASVPPPPPDGPDDLPPIDALGEAQDEVDAAPSLDAQIAALAALPREKRADGMRALFADLAALDNFEIAALKPQVIEKLEIGKREFDDYLKVARKKNGQPKLNNDRYKIEAGRLCSVSFDRDGLLQTTPLCNFVAQIACEEERDDGQESARHFILEGTTENGAPLPSIRVSTSDFENVAKWSVKGWGSRAVVRAGQSTRDKLREAIQLVSLAEGIETRRVFTHTGWRQIDGQRVYLTASGALGLDGVQVELEQGLTRYAIPAKPEDLRGAMEASLRFLQVADLTVSVPLWASMFLAPLTPILPPDFLLWLYGPTGSFKSTIAALALSHYGQFDYEHLPARWLSTKNEIEKLCFLVKDAPLVVDNFTPQASRYHAQEMEDAARRIIYAVGDRAGRGRLNRDTSLRAPTNPRGLVFASGEQLPSGLSIMARLLGIEMDPRLVNVDRLSACQKDARRYPHALAGYLLWLAPQWDSLARELPTRFEEVRHEAWRGQHARLPSTFALLHVGLDIGLQYAVEVGVLTATESDVRLREGDEALRAVISKHSERVETERPTLRFLQILSELLIQGAVHLADPEGDGSDDEDSDGKPRGGELIGWEDAEYLYLLPSAAYHRVAEYCSREGGHFPVKSTSLYRDLEAEGYLVPIRGRHTGTEWIGGEARHVLKLFKNKVQTAWGIPLEKR